MKLQTLIEKGALVQTPPTAHEVTWTPTDPQGHPLEPVSFTVYVRAPSSGWLDRARTAAARAGADRISYRSAIISHALVFGENLDEHFSYEQADVLEGRSGRCADDGLQRRECDTADPSGGRGGARRLRKKFGADAWLWHELVRAGVGGRTIAVARECLSEQETTQWAHYIHAYGPLHHDARLFARLDAGLALLAALHINRTGGIEHVKGGEKVAVHARDFMWEPPPEAREGTRERSDRG